jgi:hypothetical protein
MLALIEELPHRILVLWSLDCAEHVLPIFEMRQSADLRPGLAIEAARKWARGEIKMPEAKRAAQEAHNAATAVGFDPAACAAARAMGHAVGTVHVETHAIGVVMYGLTAFVYAAGDEAADEVIVRECQWFYDRLVYWQTEGEKIKGPWAPFLLREGVPNKEKLLRLKQEQKCVATPES